MSHHTVPAVSRGRRPGRGWTQVGRGLYRTSDGSDLAAWQLALPPSGRFTHLTAAGALGWWVPPLPRGFPVVVAVDRSGNRPVRPGLHVVRTDAARRPLEHEGLCVDPPTELLLACARDLETADLTVLLDCALHLGACSRDELDVVAATPRWGAPALRRALALADGRSESPWETLLRLLHVVCDVPVEPQHELRTPSGGFVARADLWLTGTRTIHEYDGGVHLDRGTQQADLRRARRLADAGYVRRGYTSYDLLREPAAILREADRALGRQHDPARLRAWHRLLTDSLLTGAGKDRLMRRLRGHSRT